MKRLTLMLALCVSIGASAAELRSFPNADQQQRYETLVRDLRCLVCQNQSLADSDADLAKDLRDEVYDIIRSGKSDQEAVKFLVDRYGEFVLYRPPLSSATLLLWIGPALLLLAGLIFIWGRSRQHKDDPAPELSPEERARLKDLQTRIHD